MSKSRTSTQDSAARGNKGGASDSAAKGQEVAGTAQQEAGKVAEQAQEQAGKLADMAREQATSQIDTQKERAAGQLGVLASALHAASKEIQDQDQGQVAEYIESAAGQLDQFADALRNQDIMQLADTVQQFGRRQPALFMAGAFALGFAATRFFRSSPSSDGGAWGSSGYRSPSSGSGDRTSGGGYGSARYGSDDPTSSMTASSGFGESAGATSRGDWQSGSDLGSGPEDR